MARPSAAAVQPAQGTRPDGPPWAQWAFLALWLALAPVVICKLHQYGCFTRRR